MKHYKLEVEWDTERKKIPDEVAARVEGDWERIQEDRGSPGYQSERMNCIAGVMSTQQGSDRHGILNLIAMRLLGLNGEEYYDDDKGYEIEPRMKPKVDFIDWETRTFAECGAISDSLATPESRFASVMSTLLRRDENAQKLNCWQGLHIPHMVISKEDWDNGELNIDGKVFVMTPENISINYDRRNAAENIPRLYDRHRRRWWKKYDRHG
jgi:hypothetical protein